jgi:hypothetical protein
MKRFCAIALIMLAGAGAAVAGKITGKTVFMDDVSLGSWGAITTGTAAATTGGYYTSLVTNWYRLSGTNFKGRLPVSSDITLVVSGNTNGTTNAVQLAFEPYAGVESYVVVKSFDAGSTWTNWLALSPSATNWTDTGSNSWTHSNFTNLFSLIPAPTSPWALSGSGSGSGTNTIAQVLAAGNDANGADITNGHYFAVGASGGSVGDHPSAPNRSVLSFNHFIKGIKFYANETNIVDFLGGGALWKAPQDLGGNAVSNGQFIGDMSGGTNFPASLATTSGVADAYQPLNTNLSDLADGSLTGTKVASVLLLDGSRAMTGPINMGGVGGVTNATEFAGAGSTTLRASPSGSTYVTVDNASPKAAMVVANATPLAAYSNRIEVAVTVNGGGNTFSNATFIGNGAGLTGITTPAESNVVAWISTGSTDPTVAANWNPARVPTKTDTVKVKTSSVNPQGSIYCRQLIWDQDASSTYYPHTSMTVYGDTLIYNVANTSVGSSMGYFYGNLVIDVASQSSFYLSSSVYIYGNLSFIGSGGYGYIGSSSVVVYGDVTYGYSGWTSQGSSYYSAMYYVYGKAKVVGNSSKVVSSPVMQTSIGSAGSTYCSSSYSYTSISSTWATPSITPGNFMWSSGTVYTYGPGRYRFTFRASVKPSNSTTMYFHLYKSGSQCTDVNSNYVVSRATATSSEYVNMGFDRIIDVSSGSDYFEIKVQVENSATTVYYNDAEWIIEKL